jgi:hypothetical protein
VYTAHAQSALASATVFGEGVENRCGQIRVAAKPPRNSVCSSPTRKMAHDAFDLVGSNRDTAYHRKPHGQAGVVVDFICG